VVVWQALPWFSREGQAPWCHWRCAMFTAARRHLGIACTDGSLPRAYSSAPRRPPARPPRLHRPLLPLQACTNTIMAHFAGMLFRCVSGGLGGGQVHRARACRVVPQFNALVKAPRGRASHPSITTPAARVPCSCLAAHLPHGPALLSLPVTAPVPQSTHSVP